MTNPDIRVFYWGKRGSPLSWGWWESSYRLNGTEFTNPLNPSGSYPIAIAGPNGDYTIASVVSDSIFKPGFTPYATVPIAIVNMGGELEEFNIDIASHFWATGNAADGGGFHDTWWEKNKTKFGNSNSYTSSNGFISYDNLSNRNEDNNLWYGEGFRTTDPSGIDALPTTEDASSSKLSSQTSDIYNNRHAGFGFIRDSYGDEILSSGDIINLSTPSLRTGIIGDPRIGTKGYYSSVYRTTGGYTGDECVMNVFTKKTTGNWTSNEANVWKMGHVWTTNRGGHRKTTPFGDYTIKLNTTENINGNTYSNYYIVNSNSDIMSARRILRGYIYVSLYDANSFDQGSGSPTISSNGLEGSAYGRYFFSIVMFGRYYA